MPSSTTFPAYAVKAICCQLTGRTLGLRTTYDPGWTVAPVPSTMVRSLGPTTVHVADAPMIAT